MANAVAKVSTFGKQFLAPLLLSAILLVIASECSCRNKIISTVRSSRKFHGINNGNNIICFSLA